MRQYKKLLLTEKDLTLQVELKKSQSLEAAQTGTLAMKSQLLLVVGQVSECGNRSPPTSPVVVVAMAASQACVTALVLKST